jgi:hypothetical protein
VAIKPGATKKPWMPLVLPPTPKILPGVKLFETVSENQLDYCSSQQ